MKHLFVPYELALLAKEKGFDEECFGNYFTNIEGTLLMEIPKDGHGFCSEYNSDQSKPENCAAPLYQQLLDWFRDEHKIEIVILSNTHTSSTNTRWEWSLYSLSSKKQIKLVLNMYKYYEALNSALTEAFKLI